jgi:hypothetical protein
MLGDRSELVTYVVSCGHLARPKLVRAAIGPLALNWRPARARKVVVVDMLRGVCVRRKFTQGGQVENRGWRSEGIASGGTGRRLARAWGDGSGGREMGNVVAPNRKSLDGGPGRRAWRLLLPERQRTSCELRTRRAYVYATIRVQSATPGVRQRQARSSLMRRRHFALGHHIITNSLLSSRHAH